MNPAALAAALIKKPYMRRWAGQGFTIAHSRQPRRSPGPLVPPRLTSDTLSSLQNHTQQIVTATPPCCCLARARRRPPRGMLFQSLYLVWD